MAAWPSERAITGLLTVEGNTLAVADGWDFLTDEDFVYAENNPVSLRAEPTRMALPWGRIAAVYYL